MKNMSKFFLVTSLLVASSFQVGSAMPADSLVAAAVRGDSEAVRMLIDAKADVNAQNSNGNIALIIASTWGYHEIFRMLLDKGANVNAQDLRGQTALMALLSYAMGDEKTIIEELRMLLDAGADINLINKYGETALMISQKHCIYGQLREAPDKAEVVGMLLDKGANVNIQDEDGNTALIWAARRGNAKVVRMLLEAGADANLINQHKETALDLARKRLGPLKDKNDEETVELLENHQKDEQAAFELLLEEWPACPIEVAEHCIRPFGIKLAHPDQK
jgi:ankyrin repeat protein